LELREFATADRHMRSFSEAALSRYKVSGMLMCKLGSGVQWLGCHCLRHQWHGRV